MKFEFADWLKQEMTTSASVSGATSTGDIARFARPLFSSPFKRWEDEEEEEKPKERKRKR